MKSVHQLRPIQRCLDTFSIIDLFHKLLKTTEKCRESQRELAGRRRASVRTGRLIEETQF